MGGNDWAQSHLEMNRAMGLCGPLPENVLRCMEPNDRVALGKAGLTAKGNCRSSEEATARFARFLQKNDAIRKRIQKEVRGKILVCHCHPQLSCHGNILSRIANELTSFHCSEIDDLI